MAGQLKHTWRRRRTRLRIVLWMLILAAVSGSAIWWYAAAPDPSSGTPRLVVDRIDVNLGYLHFESPARVAFTLTNAGDGPLVLTEVPRVILKAGC